MLKHYDISEDEANASRGDQQKRTAIQCTATSITSTSISLVQEGGINTKSTLVMRPL